MVRTIAFSGANSLDDDQVRRAVVRIPEVSLRLRQAQTVLDELGTQIDLFNLLGAEYEDYRGYLKYRNLMAAVVQVGLYDRYIKFQPSCQMFTSHANGEPVADVCAGDMEFEDMVRNSSAITGKEEREGALQELPVLTRGVTNCHYQVLKKSDEGTLKVDFDSYEMSDILEKLMDEFKVSQIIVIGPGDLISPEIKDTMIKERFQILESIDLDPLLTWFWSDIRRSQIASA